MKKFLWVFIILSSTAGFCQNAALLFKEKYFKVGLELGTNVMFTKNTSNPNQYKWTPFQTGNFGLVYNFYQKNDFNFKISALYSAFDLTEKASYRLENGSVLVSETSSGPYALLIFPLETEYYIKLNDRAHLSLNSGVEFTVNPNGKDEGFSSSGVSSGGFTSQTNVTEYSRDSPLYFGLNAGVSLNLSTKPLLIKLTAKYHYQLENYIYEGIATTDINGNSSVSRHNITGDYIGFGATFIPSKNLLKW